MQTTTDIPEGARPCARILLIDQDLRLLLLQAVAFEGNPFWLTPGGGLDDGESFAAAAARELLEETGLTAEFGPCVWTRHHVYDEGDRRYDQYERFFIARTMECDVRPQRPDTYITGYRWWTLPEIQATTAPFAPRRLPELLPPILDGVYPESPFDCGV